MTASAPGRLFIWHELLSLDPEAIRPFYEAVAGWSSATAEGGGSPYWIWSTGGAVRGGLMELPESAADAGAPPHWLGYVQSPDVDADSRRAEELGGEAVMAPEDVPGVGRIAVLRDPQGAVLSVFEPTSDEMPGAPGSGPGSFSWAELAADDFDGAWEFYTGLFGWSEAELHDMGPLGPYRTSDPEASEWGACSASPPTWPGPLPGSTTYESRMPKRERAGYGSTAEPSCTVRRRCPAATGSSRRSIPRGRPSPSTR